MDYNGLCTSLLLMKLSNGEYIPLPSVQASYGPFNSMNEAKADLIDTFKEISNVPRGYTFCIIENEKPQEYWFTKEGDWSSVEKKNTSSSSSSISSELVIQAIDGYLQVSYDGGDTWTKLVSLESLKGPAGIDGKDAVADLSKIQIRMTSKTVQPTDPDESSYTEYVLEYTRNGGTNWINIGTIKSGSGGSGGTEHIITIETWTDGNQYWKQDGNWMLDDNNNMVRANGKDGADGADGAGYNTQFKSIIFKRSNNTRIVNNVELLAEEEYPDSSYPSGGTYEHPVPYSGNWYDGVPAGTEKLWMSTRWFSTNEAITVGNNWSVPAPATDTSDIDFEYSNAPLSTTPNGPGPYKNINIYNATTNPNGWYDADESSEYDGNTLLQNANWMAMRICRNGIWGEWKILKIRGESGEDALVPVVEFTSVVFRRSNNVRTVGGQIKLAESEYPQGGSYESPVPTNRDSNNVLLWTDGLPVGNNELLWMSTRIFRSDGNHSAWKEPIQATDGANGYDFEWCDEETPTFPYPTRTSPDDNNSGKQAGDTWYDEASQNSDPIWMAMRAYEGNEYTAANWTVMRVKGEKGTDGTSFVPKGQLFGIFDTTAQAKAYYDAHASSLGNMRYAIIGTSLTELYEYSSTYPNGRRITDLTIGDAYVNSGGAGKYDKVSGDLKEHVFIWDGDNFVDFGNIQGPEGVGTYFHIKYSDDGGVSFTFSGLQQDGETPGRYIGLRVDRVAEDSMNPRDYKWTEFRGEDGFGYEYIFKLTNEDTAPTVPTLEDCVDYKVDEGTQDERTVTFQDDDYVPEFLGWTDDPESPTKAKPYCWVAYRRKINSAWQAYRGGSADPTRAARFSTYTSNGRGIDHITEMYAVWDSGLKTDTPPLTEFSETVPPFDLTDGKIYLWNYEIIHYDDDTEQTTEPECIAVSEKGVGIDTIQEFYYASSFGDSDANDLQTHLPQWGGPNRSSSWKTKPMNVNKDTPYLWNFELVIFTDGSQWWTNPVIIAYYVYTDIEYLTTVFKKVEGNSDTAYLGGLVGVTEKDSNDNDVVRAVLNATDAGKSNEHGKLFMASGMNGVQDIDNSTFKVYEDGHVEMRDAQVIDADIQGFLRQYFYRQHEIYDASLGIHKFTKDANAIQLGWEGLSFVEDEKSYSFTNNYIDVNFLEKLPPGRIFLTNQMYSLKNGNVYFNNRCQATRLGGRFIYLDGKQCSIVGDDIILKNGWVEILHIKCKDTEYNDILPTYLGSDKFIILGIGGLYEIPISESITKVNDDGLYINEAADGSVTPSTKYRFAYDINISNTNIVDNIVRLSYANKRVSLSPSISTSTNSPLYVLLPVGTYGGVQENGNFEILLDVQCSNSVIFKNEILGSITPSESVSSLSNSYFKNLSGNTITQKGLYRITKWATSWIIETLGTY